MGRSFPEGRPVTWPESDLSPTLRPRTPDVGHDHRRTGPGRVLLHRHSATPATAARPARTAAAAGSSQKAYVLRLTLPHLLTRLIIPAKAPSVRRACVACHTGKTRCSEVLPCQVRFVSVLIVFIIRQLFLLPPELSQARSRFYLCISRS